MPVRPRNVCQRVWSIGRPNGATGTTSPTRSRSISCSRRVESSVQLVASTSATKGSNPHSSTARAVPTNVSAGITASGRSVAARPAVARIAPTSAAVPELAHTIDPGGCPRWLHRRCWSSWTRGPQLEYVRVSSIRARYGRSRFAVGRSGRSTGIDGSWRGAAPGSTGCRSEAGAVMAVGTDAAPRGPLAPRRPGSDARRRDRDEQEGDEQEPAGTGRRGRRGERAGRACSTRGRGRVGLREQGWRDAEGSFERRERGARDGRRTEGPGQGRGARARQRRQSSRPWLARRSGVPRPSRAMPPRRSARVPSRRVRPRCTGRSQHQTEPSAAERRRSRVMPLRPRYPPSRPQR